ncbi:MAG: alpha/beta hydrolase [Novosphingobium sp. 28-62-57]|uniref:alpha/beta fold hydrolase n=1 Tax=unclassified Novosphingobium TaxID=2644732 RepID=UPI000BC51994|nr:MULTISPECIES: alpha/beta hydrolase [unclassified Novosphingobium]OYW49234.1 MAG: alpha/beta hydrolase [Novosphingobium sp. 12-62-10]OYZ09739.1 MAG: alpha/beta hydrolase [Novosphingobium sp. 28-62-57]OZA35797.1 MAG: alpha/beta hydrolase [Novosphingobium sp. 17-62-9]HQS70377.1 alpha/beta hydrolase [Novosphingobium sp.]
MQLLGPTSNTFISQRLRLHYVDWGNADKPPLLLVHGGRDHCRSWDWTAEALREDWHIIAMDHRGHGDSQWTEDGNYRTMDLVYDVAQLIHQLDLAPVTIVSHSWGANTSLRYAGLFPENVRKIVAIEGLFPTPDREALMKNVPFARRVREFIVEKRKAAGRLPRRYPTLEDAYARMKGENPYLTDVQARHLTLHGINRNEDGTFSWKFDPHLNVDGAPYDISIEQRNELWKAITCPTLLLNGADSWAGNPERNGMAEYFRNAQVVEFENAGHWVHHDQFDKFIATLKDFL